MSRPVGLPLFCVDGCFRYRGDAAGDKDFSENVVVGESSFGWLPEFHPKNDVNFPAAGDFGLFWCGELGEGS